MTEHVHHTLGSHPLTKALFTNFLAKIWRQGLSASNIKSRFASTGIFPLDSTKYKEEWICKIKLKSYHAWKEAGSALNDDGDPIIPNDNAATDIPDATPDNWCW